MADASNHQRSSRTTLAAPRTKACLPCQLLRQARCERQQGWVPGTPCESCKREGIVCTFGGTGLGFRENAELADLEMFKTTRVTLVDDFFAAGYGSILIPSSYRVALCSAASLQMKALAPTTKALLAMVVATSARSTMHPFFIVAVRRQATCSALLNQAIQIASESGVLRRVGMGEVLTLKMISLLLPWQDPQQKSLAWIYRGHQIQLDEENAKTRAMTAPHPLTSTTYNQLWDRCLGWEPFLGDIWSAYMARTLMRHSDEVLAAYSASVAEMTGCRGPLDALSRSVFDMLRCSFEALIMGHRLAVRYNFARRSAKSKVGRLAAIHAALDESFILRSRAAAEAVDGPQARFTHACMGLAAGLACHLAFVVDDPPRCLPDADVWRALHRLRTLRESRWVVKTFKRVMEYQVNQATTPMSLAVRPMWDKVVDCMVAAPVTASPGDSDLMTWTAAEKTAEIADAVHVLEAHVWSWPENRPSLEKAQAAQRCLAGEELFGGVQHADAMTDA